jgi:two-component system response regulator YesN
MYNIITVDDERMVKRGLYKIIESAGEQFQVVGEASNGQEALEQIRQYKPHMLITDISMPVMDGLELTAEVSREYPQIKIVIISGYGEFQYAQKALRYKVQDYLLKPIDPEELLRILIRSHEEYYHARDKSTQDSKQLLLNLELLEDIATELWHMDEAAVNKKLILLFKAIGQGESEPGWVEQIYNDLLALLLKKLYEKSGRVLTVNILENNDLVIHPELFSVQIQAACNQLLEQIIDLRHPGQRRIIQKALDFIRSNYKNPDLLLQDVTAFISMSPTYFSRLFKEETGVTFMKYLTDMRIERAKKLLAEPETKIIDIAEEVGYSNYHHFAKTFRKHVGMTPTDYRKVRGVY